MSTISALKGYGQKLTEWLQHFTRICLISLREVELWTRWMSYTWWLCNIFVHHSILDLLKWWNLKCFKSSSVMDFWNEETLNCLKILIWKLTLWKWQREAVYFCPVKSVWKWLACCEILNDFNKPHLFPKSHHGNKTNWTQHKGELADKIFSKMDVLRKWEQVTILLQTLCNVHD